MIIFQHLKSILCINVILTIQIVFNILIEIEGPVILSS